jgi:hypothetical protein
MFSPAFLGGFSGSLTSCGAAASLGASTFSAFSASFCSS